MEHVEADPLLFVDTEEIRLVPPGGTHILIDMLTECSSLGSVDFLERTLLEAAKASGATVLMSKFHHFGDGYGVTGVVLLAESHITIHTWPESNYAAIDVFMCGKCDPNDTLAIFDKVFDPITAVYKTAIRTVPAVREKLLN